MRENGFDIHHVKLDNGVKVIATPMSGRRSVVVGVWCLSGSAYEPDDKIGISHFLEHMIFKGSRRYSAKEIVTTIERLGGSIDAYTSKQETCFHATVLGEDIDTAVDVLSDIVLHPRLTSADVEVERSVIISEIREAWENADSLAQEILPAVMFMESPLARPILGSINSVRNIKTEDLKEYWAKNFVSGNFIVAASGALDFEYFVSKVAEKFSDAKQGALKRELPPGKAKEGTITLINYDCQQVHVFVSARTFPFADERRYELALIDAILGRGSSSRLFQKVREEKGLAYNIQSFSELYTSAGLWAVYAATSPDNLTRLLESILHEIDALQTNGISERELEDAKSFVRRRLLLSSESPWNNIARAIEADIHLGRYIPLSETIERIVSVKPENVVSVANEILNRERLSILILGPVKKVDNLGFRVDEVSVTDVFPWILG
ncbi:insulinase family protein [bacterium]|nr:insulinase family protein [bacterium]